MDPDAKMPLEDSDMEKPPEDSDAELPLEDSNVEKPLEDSGVEVPPEGLDVEKLLEDSDAELPLEDSDMEEPPEDSGAELPLEDPDMEKPPEDADAELPPEDADGEKPLEEPSAEEPPEDSGAELPLEDSNAEKPLEDSGVGLPLESLDGEKPPEEPDVEKPLEGSGVEMLLERQRTVAAQQGCEFVFSIIVPIYNTAAYLEECIQSVVEQSVGFDDVQLLLVDDGSTDESAAICERYAKRFSSNVVFLQQENAGVSAARNLGLEHARGLWINFLDSDDMWSRNAFEVMLRFSARHPEVRMVSMRHWFFGAFEGPHPLDYKYESDRVIDILRDADVIQLSFSNMFVRASLLAQKRFDTSLDFAEDFNIVGPLMLRERFFGVCRDGSYRYRKRADGGSAIDTSTSKASYYEKAPYMCDLNLFRESVQLFGEVIPYAQWCVMYELQFRLRIRVNESLDNAAVRRYRSILCELLSHIDDEVIVTQRHMSLPDKLYALQMKYGVPMREMLANGYIHGGELYWRHEGRPVRLFAPDIINRVLRVEHLDFTGGAITIVGWSDFLCEDARPSMQIMFRTGGFEYEAAYVWDEDQQIETVFAQDELYRQGFSATLPWNAKSRAVVEARIRFYGREYPAWFSFGEGVGLDEHQRNSYCRKGGMLYRVQSVAPGHNRIVVNRSNVTRRLVFKSRLMFERIFGDRSRR